MEEELGAEKKPPTAPLLGGVWEGPAHNLHWQIQARRSSAAKTMLKCTSPSQSQLLQPWSWPLRWVMPGHVPVACYVAVEAGVPSSVLNAFPERSSVQDQAAVPSGFGVSLWRADSSVPLQRAMFSAAPHRAPRQVVCGVRAENPGPRNRLRRTGKLLQTDTGVMMASSLWVSVTPCQRRLWETWSANVILRDKLSPRNCCQLCTAYKSIKLYILSRG